MKPTIQMSNGKYFDYLDPMSCIDVIDIEVVAHSLSNTCRYIGHVDQFYSVAQHSVLASHVRPEEGRIAAYHKLMHDVEESLIHDIASPVKLLIKHCYSTLDVSVSEFMGCRFQISDRERYKAQVRYADLSMLATERRDLLTGRRCTSLASTLLHRASLYIPFLKPSKQLPRLIGPTLDGEWEILNGIEEQPERVWPWSPQKAYHEFIERYLELRPFPERWR